MKLNLTLIILFTCSIAFTKPLNFLFIGNSYTYFNEMPYLLEMLSEQESNPVKVKVIAKGGFTLEKHWENLKSDKLLKETHWDYLSLQEQSMRPIKDPKLMIEYGQKISKLINNNAKRFVYLTWARKNKPEQQSLINKSYQTLAKLIHAELVPVGTAWQLAKGETPKINLYHADNSHPNLAGVI